MLLKIDGVARVIPLEGMMVKDCIFIPTLTNAEARRTVRSACDAIGIKCKIVSTVHKGYLGIMVWRTE
jgi:hypothetical protein